MQKLVILDYNLGSIYFYDIKDDTEVNDFFIDGLGHRGKDCCWMIADNIPIYYYTKSKYKCSKCGSTKEISVLASVDPNTKQFIEFVDNSNLGWCDCCMDEVEIVKV